MKQIKKNYKRRGKIYIVVAFKEKHGYNQFNGNNLATENQQAKIIYVPSTRLSAFTSAEAVCN